MRPRSWPQLLSASLLLLFVVPCRSSIPIPLPFPGGEPVEVGGSLPVGYEPSGGAWHPRIRKVFCVGDGGTVSMMDSSGTSVTNFTVPGDLEGIAVADPATDFVYAGIENPDSILEFNFVTGQVTRTFMLDSWMKGPPNDGLEALAFVPDANNPEGGLFYAGLQSDGKIYVFQLPIKSSATSTAVTYIRTLQPAPGRNDISSLEWDWTYGMLWVAWDSANVLSTMTPDGILLVEWKLPGLQQEGIAIKPNTLFVMQDGGSVLRYSFPTRPGFAGPEGGNDTRERLFTESPSEVAAHTGPKTARSRD